MLLTRHLIETELKKGKYVCLSQIDLTCAFDCIQCDEILPKKIAHYGADEKATSFFKSFFTGRSHYCEWNGERSEPTPLFNYSCIQGSSAGAIIYNLYTRDLNNVTDDELVGFADDVNIVSSNDDPNQLIKETNKELKKGL